MSTSFLYPSVFGLRSGFICMPFQTPMINDNIAKVPTIPRTNPFRLYILMIFIILLVFFKLQIVYPEPFLGICRPHSIRTDILPPSFKTDMPPECSKMDILKRYLECFFALKAHRRLNYWYLLVVNTIIFQLYANLW